MGGRGRVGGSCEQPALCDELSVEVAGDFAGGQRCGERDGFRKAVVQHFELIVTPIDHPSTAFATDLHAINDVPLIA